MLIDEYTAVELRVSVGIVVKGSPLVVGYVRIIACVVYAMRTRESGAGSPGWDGRTAMLASQGKAKGVGGASETLEGLCLCTAVGDCFSIHASRTRRALDEENSGCTA